LARLDEGRGLLGGNDAFAQVRVQDAFDRHDSSEFLWGLAIIGDRARGCCPTLVGWFFRRPALVLRSIVLHCSVQLARAARTIALHPDVGEGAKPADSPLSVGFFMTCR